jgi:mRNA interferase ChpB
VVDTGCWKIVARIGFAVPIRAIATTGVIRCDQPWVIDRRARRRRQVDRLPRAILQAVLARIRPLFA